MLRLEFKRFLSTGSYRRSNAEARVLIATEGHRHTERFWDPTLQRSRSCQKTPNARELIALSSVTVPSPVKQERFRVAQEVPVKRQTGLFDTRRLTVVRKKLILVSIPRRSDADPFSFVQKYGIGKSLFE